MKKTFILSILFTFAAFFANAQKFGIVNSQEIISMLPEVKEASANIETFGNQLQKKYQQMITSLQAKYQDLERKQAQGEISPKQLEEEAKLLKDEESKLAQYEQSSQQQIVEKQNSLMQPIMERINEAIKSHSIFSRSSTSFLCSTGNSALTQLIVLSLNLIIVPYQHLR